MKRRVKVRIPPGVGLERFLDELMAAIQAQYAGYEVRGDHVLLTLVGDPASLARSQYAIKRVMTRFRAEAASSLEGRSIIPKSEVARVLGRPVPLDLLKDLLELMGIRYVEGEEELVVELGLEELRRVAEELFQRYEASRELFAGVARKVASLVSMVEGKGLDQVFSEALEAGVMEKGEDGRARLRVHRERALSLLLGA